jgi:hypothetical protein
MDFDTTKIVIDVSSGEHQIVQKTQEEIENELLIRSESEARKQQQIAEEEQNDLIKASARAKLAALGLTEEEVAALIK